ncbi:MAG: zinc ribbon domain-containing protein [Firmicutes bacterium]|nr:zinc ribbon domain-containing protein [Bacillota bacterium]
MGNEAYAGVFYANRYDASGVCMNPYLPRAERSKVKMRPRSEWIPVRVPAIVDEATCRRAGERLAAARRLWAGAERAQYLLSGLVVCGECGRPMTGSRSTDWGVPGRFYVCRRDKGGCGRRVGAEVLESAVWEPVRGVVREQWDIIAARRDDAARTSRLCGRVPEGAKAEPLEKQSWAPDDMTPAEKREVVRQMVREVYVAGRPGFPRTIRAVVNGPIALGMRRSAPPVPRDTRSRDRDLDVPAVRAEDEGGGVPVRPHRCGQGGQRDRPD